MPRWIEGCGMKFNFKEIIDEKNKNFLIKSKPDTTKEQHRERVRSKPHFTISPTMHD